jgi:hypothetical protein
MDSAFNLLNISFGKHGLCLDTFDELLLLGIPPAS